MSKYIPTVGIEVHLELKTATKIFSNSVNGYGSGANTLVNVVDLGYPGTLPTLNEEVVNLAIKTAIILNCNITKEMHFDRKNYFYPDNPKNYQITQSRTPIGRDGYVEIEVDGESKKIFIEEIHIEEDTSKSVHRGEATLLDFNRAGVPLIEIVTKPCIESSNDAKLYIEKLKETLLYAGISDCKMEEGSMRCDANVSLRKNDSDQLGTKCEVKNIGSVSSVGVAIEKEIIRQEKALDNGEVLQEQTRRYDEKLEDTVLMRMKEKGNDYRYFPEPDLPFLILSDDKIEAVRNCIPMMPDERREKYLEKGIVLNSANKLILDKEISDYLGEFLDLDMDFVIASNLLLGDIKAYLNKESVSIYDTKLNSVKFIDLVHKISNDTLSSKNLKDIMIDILESDNTIDEIIKLKGISNISDESYLVDITRRILEDNLESVSDYKAGKDRALKYLMGMIMKETKGNANPKLTSKILEDLLKR